MTNSKHHNNIVPYDRLLLKQIKKDAERELKRLYWVTQGFQDPDPPTAEAITMFLEGFWEL